jgi:hypothetical protein
MKVWVETPTVAGDTVHFRWRQSEPNPFQHQNEFFFRYEDLDLAIFSPHLFTEIFLALQLKVFAGYAKPVELIFPEPVPALSAAYWRAFHDADQVSIGPVADIDRYEPLVGKPRTAKKTAAIFYGGGKDSVLAAGLLSEIFGADQVLLIQYVAPLRPAPGRAAQLELRHETLMLAPIRAALGVATRRVWSNYQANFVEAGYAHRPHLELYTAGALPVLLDAGVEVSSFGSTRTDYPILPRNDGGRRYVFARSRPEMLATQSRHYQRALGFNHTLTNVNFPFTTAMDMQFLYARYPDLAPVAVMCTYTRENKPWCYNCPKCLNYALYALAAGYVDPRFDYDRMFSDSPAVAPLIGCAETGVELSYYGNVPWFEEMTHPTTYQAVCHAIAKSDPDRLKDRLGPDARANLCILIALYGNTRFANQESVVREVVEFPDVDLVRRVGKLAAEHFPVVDRFPAPWMHGAGEAIIDFETRMSTRTGLLPHIQSNAVRPRP